MDFREVEKRFEELKSMLNAGTIDDEEFEAELRELYAVDGEGRYWMIGAQSEQWYYYDGTHWVQAEPPEEEVRPPAEALPPVPARPPSFVEPAMAPVPPTKRKAARLAIPIVLGVAALCFVLSAASLAISELVLPNKPISSFVSGLRGPTLPRATPVRTFEASPTAGLSALEHIRAGDELFGDERYEEAIAEYQVAISVDPQNGEAYARLGEVYVQLGNCDQAVPEFQQALTLSPELESAKAGLMECGGTLPQELAFESYSRSDLNFSLLYPSTWSVREEQLQTIFAQQEEDIASLRGNIFFMSSLPLEPGEENLDDMGALQKAIELISLPMGSQLGGVELVTFGGQEWAAVQGEIVGLQTPTTIYVAATVKEPTWYGIWAIGAAETWAQTSWPVFRVMAGSVQLGQVVAMASPAVETSPVGETPTVSGGPSPSATATSQQPTPTREPGASPTAVSPSPTATPKPPTLTGKIAYPVYVGGQDHYEIHIAAMDGSTIAEIYAASEPGLDPGGSRIAYRSWDTAFRGLVIANVDGANPQRPRGGEAPNEDSLTRWSSDGRSLVYASKRSPPRLSHVIRHLLSSGEEHQLGEGDSPDWSADGKHIVAETYAGLVTMDATGENRQQLTSNPGDHSPDWSPTGNNIAFMRQTGINWDIWVVASDGSGEKQLTTNGSIEGLPAWSPDGTSIAFLSDRGGTWAIWAMNADGSNQRKLFNTGCTTYGTGEGFDGEWLGKENWQRRDWLDEQISWSR